MARYGLLPALLVLGLFPKIAFADGGPAADIFEKFVSPAVRNLSVEAKAVSEPETALAGESFRIRVAVTIPQGWHIYSLRLEGGDSRLATRIDLRLDAFPPVTEWEESAPVLAMDGVSQKILKTHSGSAEFFQTRRAPEDLAPGEYPVSGFVEYSACDNKVCALPKRSSFKTRVKVKGRG
ncbi:MAG: hypothetical protein HY579_08760 [Nitrospinae bacterium]|nr:hypothetical protein [Nitrospinota bacterium]